MAISEEENDVWRILLFGRRGEELLLLRSPSGFRLPELRIPRCQRVAPNLNAEAKRRWKLDTVCLVPLEVPHGDLTTGGTNYHAMELCGHEELVRVAPNFMHLSTLKEDSFADPRDYLAVRQGMELESCGPGKCRGPFSGFGAFGEISAWVAEQLWRHGLRLHGDFRQLQATASFALIRFVTNRGAVWFKAVGEPNVREFRITSVLEARLPLYLPELLAVSTKWNAWLAKEVDGRHLFEPLDPAGWYRVAKFLAGLQIASVGDASHILAAGARDVRAQNLMDIATPFFSAMEEAMEAQIKTVPRRLTRQEINILQEQVVDALHIMERAGLPDALNHLDLNPGNVFVSPDKCTFLDWAEAAVGNPFFSLEYLRQHFLHAFPDWQVGEQELRKSYLKRWNSIVTQQTADDLSHLLPLTATFAFAAAALPWRDLKLSPRRGLAAFLRSLGRRMHRESEQLSARCIS